MLRYVVVYCILTNSIGLSDRLSKLTDDSCMHVHLDKRCDVCELVNVFFDGKNQCALSSHCLQRVLYDFTITKYM